MINMLNEFSEHTSFRSTMFYLIAQLFFTAVSKVKGRLSELSIPK
jgi:hypothetical protein